MWAQRSVRQSGLDDLDLDDELEEDANDDLEDTDEDDLDLDDDE